MSGGVAALASDQPSRRRARPCRCVAALRDGYHVVLFDGPDHGELLIDEGLPLRHDWEKVVKPVVDAAPVVMGRLLGSIGQRRGLVGDGVGRAQRDYRGDGQAIPRRERFATFTGVARWRLSNRRVDLS